MLEEIHTQSTRLCQINAFDNIVEHHTHDFFFIQNKMNPSILLTLSSSWIVDGQYLLIWVSWKRSVYNGALRRLWGFSWAPKGNTVCDVLPRGATHLTFGQIPRTNSWFYFGSRYYQFHFLACYWERNWLQAKVIIYNWKIFGCKEWALSKWPFAWREKNCWRVLILIFISQLVCF